MIPAPEDEYDNGRPLYLLSTFHYEENQVGVTSPDLPGCVTVSKDETDAIKCAKEALGLHIYGMEVDGESIPAPSSIKNLPQKKGTICVLVDVWMPLIRASVKEYSVKKTLTIPAWMDRAAKEAGIKNYSLMLQVAIAQELGIDIKAETPFSHPAPTIA